MASPYSTGGGGIHFEAEVVAYYLAAALAEAPARAVPGLHVTQVLTQRAAFGEPLDDVIVNGILEDGRPTKLSLQVKSSLTFTENDEEWGAVLGQAWATFTSGTFDAVRDRLGVAINSYNARADKYYQSVLSWAAHSLNGQDFAQRITRKDFSHKDQRAFVTATRKILSNHAGTTVDDDALWRFLCVFRILHFDFDTEDASRDAAGALDRIRHCLPLEHRGQAAPIWKHLIVEAGEIAPSGGGASRESLAASLQKVGLPSGSGATFWRDIQMIDQESKRALASIKNDIHGLRLNRMQAYEQVQDALRTARFVQVDGEPGSGKSALLKQLAEEAAQFGPIFLLKDSRIQPRGWAAHAGQLGISGDFIGLMSEFGTVAEPILFIDGIDKVNDPAAQLTVNDLVRAIASEPALSHWKILVTVREQNLDHIATWLDPDALKHLPVRSVTISQLGSDELNVVSVEFPRLRPLLLESGRTDVILRRPFFLEAVLSLSGREGTTSLPATEVELLNLWWELGGADQPDFTPAQHRRNALVSLAERFIVAPDRAISIRDLPPRPLEDLKSAGVIREKQLGHSVTFSHDIYEEWALCEWLIGELPCIASALKTSKEPQALIRPVQLLGSYELETSSTETEWQRLYEELADASLRPVWQRAVLTSCLRSTRTTEILGRLANYLHQNNDNGLKKLLNALQTLEVVPNANFLDEAVFPDLEPEERVSFAHAAALPKLLTWVRFLDWYLPHAGEPSPSLIPDLLPVFRTWQSACAGQNIRHCQRIGEIAQGWLTEFEAALHPESFQNLRDPFGIDLNRDEERDLEGAIRKLFLSSTGDIPELVASYLDAKARRDRLRHMYREKILSDSATIGKWLPKQLVDYIIAAFLRHPKNSKHPESFSNLISKDLGIEGDRCFYPASPYQPPFLLLLRHHEEEGLRLVKAICNHSVDVWRWLCQRPDYHRKAVAPLPVEIEFPWGKQVFWGDGQVYQWFRGTWGSDASRSALMALEFWAFERIDVGDDFAEVFRKVLDGNDSVAALGLAVSLCLAHPDRSVEHALPLITCPHLWKWDLARLGQERSGMPVNEMGDWHRYRYLLSAVRDLNRRSHRHACLRDMVPYFVFCSDDSLKERYTVGIQSFTERLPFEYAEERYDEAHEAGLKKSMHWYVEQADPQFWHSEPTEDGKKIKFWNDPPSANSQERLQQLENHAQLNRYLRLALWAQNSLDNDKLEDSVSIGEALAEAQDLDFKELFDGAKGTFEEANRKAAVAGVAYIVTRFSDDDFWEETTASWALGTLIRAAAFRGFDDITYRGSILTMHPLIFAVHGLAASMARGYMVEQCQSVLLDLSVAPLVSVLEAVATSAKFYGAKNPDFQWVLFNLFVRQCIIERKSLPNYHSPYWDEAEETRNSALLEAAYTAIETGVMPRLPAVPMPYVEREDQCSEDPEENRFIQNPLCFQWHIAQRTILRANLDVFMATPERRSQFVTLIDQLVAMTIQEIVPPFAKSRRDHGVHTPFEWVFSFFSWLGRVASHLSPKEVESILLQPLFATDNETALLAMQNFAPSYLVHSLLPPAVITHEAFATWEKIAEWIIENPEGRTGGRHLDREFSLCVFSLLFCLGGDFQPLVCVAEEEWSSLDRFKPIIERVVRKFGTNPHLYLGVLRFFKKGGLDMMPQPGLSWLREIALAKKQDQDFWRPNGDETVEILKLILSKKTQSLSAAHRSTISFITDILVDNGVRGAGFLQQDQLRQ